MVAIITRAGVGVPGAVTRTDSKTIKQEIIDSGTPPTAYGSFVKMVSGKLRPIASGDAATVVYGVLVRPYPQQSASNDFGAATPPTSGIADVLRRGFIAVKVTQGTPASRGTVYVRVTAASGKLVGDIEAVSDSTNSVVVAGAEFTGAADANGIAEISFNI